MNVKFLRTWDARKSAYVSSFRMLFCSPEMAAKFWERENCRMRIQFDPKRLPA